MEYINSATAAQVVSGQCRHAEGSAVSAEQPGVAALVLTLPHPDNTLPHVCVRVNEGLAPAQGVPLYIIRQIGKIVPHSQARIS